MPVVTEGYLRGTLRWIKEIKQYKKDMAKWRIQTKKRRRELLSSGLIAPHNAEAIIEKEYPKPLKKTVSTKALNTAKEFIQSQRKSVDKSLFPLIDEIMQETFT